MATICSHIEKMNTSFRFGINRVATKLNSTRLMRLKFKNKNKLLILIIITHFFVTLNKFFLFAKSDAGTSQRLDQTSSIFYSKKSLNKVNNLDVFIKYEHSWGFLELRSCFTTG